ncbi:DMT family transporter [Salsuginibacillus kocurii]|uniref:DMT family transporter n=1 Tax=Salsuginibacillus kocurii TaxID=427078 RepID=UPI00036451DE|nr:SMR family transporter [Salsuginibacillus kocurii]
MKTYLLLAGSIVLEVLGATFMIPAEGFTRLGPSLVVIGSYGLTLALYIILTHQHELGIINALWAGGGTALVTVSGFFFFNETLTFLKVIGVLCIIVGVIGLNLQPEQNTSEKEAV